MDMHQQTTPFNTGIVLYCTLALAMCSLATSLLSLSCFDSHNIFILNDNSNFAL